MDEEDNIENQSPGMETNMEEDPEQMDMEMGDSPAAEGDDAMEAEDQMEGEDGMEPAMESMDGEAQDEQDAEEGAS